MYLRANIAVTGLFALNKSEPVLFLQDLTIVAAAARRITYASKEAGGGARWSITAYADDNF